jgi:hypothetical protein
LLIEVFVTQAQAEDALLQEIGERVLDQFGVPVIGEARGKLVEEAEMAIDFAEQ